MGNEWRDVSRPGYLSCNREGHNELQAPLPEPWVYSFHSFKVMGFMIRLFVASDYPVVRAGFRSILDASDEFQVVGEGALDEAAGQAAALAVEVMLLDVSGSDRDEMEALWRLSSDAPGLAIVLLSSDPGEGAAREALQAGARAYLLRDASSEEIRAAVLAAHRGLTVLHPAVARSLFAAAVPQPGGSPAEPLTPRELEVLRLLAQGLPSKTIAGRLRISEHTVKFHVGAIMSKLGAASRTEAVTLAIRRGLVAL